TKTQHSTHWRKKSDEQREPGVALQRSPTFNEGYPHPAILLAVQTGLFISPRQPSSRTANSPNPGCRRAKHVKRFIILGRENESSAATKLLHRECKNTPLLPENQAKYVHFPMHFPCARLVCGAIVILPRDSAK